MSWLNDDLATHNWYADEYGVWCVKCHKDPYNCNCSAEFHQKHDSQEPPSQRTPSQNRQS